MKKIHHISILTLSFIILLTGLLSKVSAQQYKTVNKSWTPVDNNTLENIDYTRLNLPSLDTLFTSARFNNPEVLKAMKTKEFQEQLTKKERRYWLSFFSTNAHYAYGINDSYLNNSSSYIPAYQTYTGGSQNYWNVGVSASINLESLLDLKDRVKRQRLQADMAAYDAENTFNTIKKNIIELYVEISNTLTSMKYTSEIAADYQGSGLVMRERFLNNQADITELAGTRKDEVGIRQNYQGLLTKVSTDLLILEVITGYPIISRSDVPLWGDSFDWSKFDLSKWLPEWFKDKDLAKLQQYYKTRYLRFVDQTNTKEYTCKVTTIQFTHAADYYKLVFKADDESDESITLSVQELLTLSLKPQEWIYYNNFSFKRETQANSGKLWIQDSAKPKKTINK